MKVLLKEKKNSIACIAIGKKFYNHWEKNILPFWRVYCKKNDLGLIVFTEDLIDSNDPNWKKPTWQRLLVGQKIKEKFPNVQNICILDLDILINPQAPNIFKFLKKNKINLTSLRKNLPFEYKKTIRKMSFFRRKYTNPDYPLDSLLNSNLVDLYKADGLKSQNDELCVGVMAFNVKKFSTKLYDWFFEFSKKNMKSNFGGCQNQVASKILSNNYCNLLDYKFQAIWVFELAARFPILMKYLKNNQLISDFALSIILDNYFLHFAGGGVDAKVWLKNNFFEKINKKIILQFQRYYMQKLKGNKIYRKKQRL